LSSFSYALLDFKPEREMIENNSDKEVIKAAEYPFDSIMVDMSHHEKEENLALTTRITTMLHKKGIATEAEPGRINGGEDGVKDTGDLEVGVFFFHMRLEDCGFLKISLSHRSSFTSIR
jgi:hypothetical protein